MTSGYVAKIPFPKWCYLYGKDPSIIIDANAGWHILWLCSINGQSSTFRCRVWRWLYPYETMDYLETAVPVVHASFAVNGEPNSTLWVVGFNDPAYATFQSVPDFIFPADKKIALAPSLEPATIPLPHNRSLVTAQGFTSRTPVEAGKQLGTVTRVIERYKINRIAKRYNV